MEGHAELKLQGPLVLESQGHFFVGGRPEDDDWGGQMYVQFMIPAALRQEPAVLMIHGGWQTGANFLGTPDGRPGWAEFFVRQGYAVYVVDLPGCGRAGPQARLGDWRGVGIARTEALFTAPEHPAHVQWPGTGRRGDRAFEQFMSSQQRVYTDRVKFAQACVDACSALIERIGRCTILAHSLASTITWPLAQRHPGSVNAIVAVEPNGPPFVDAPPLGDGSTIAREWGISHLPLAFEPEAHEPGELGRLRGIDTEISPVFEPGATRRRLTGLDGIPTCVVTGAASHHAAYDGRTVSFLRQFGVSAEHIELGQIGIPGNGHMLMLEKNSLQIAAVINDWILARSFASTAAADPGNARCRAT